MVDQVLVIDHGRILERGDYEDLLRAGTCRQQPSREVRGRSA
jgi:ABC-type multidrug transport system fused ATPase/permease subunit